MTTEQKKKFYKVQKSWSKILNVVIDIPKFIKILGTRSDSSSRLRDLKVSQKEKDDNDDRKTQKIFCTVENFTGKKAQNKKKLTFASFPNSCSLSLFEFQEILTLFFFFCFFGNRDVYYNYDQRHGRKLD